MKSDNQFKRQRREYDSNMSAIEKEIHEKCNYFHTQLQLEEDRIIRFVKEMHSNTLSDFEEKKEDFVKICGVRNSLEDLIQDNGSFLSKQYQDCQSELAEMSEKAGITYVPELKWKKTKLEVDGICRVFRNNIELTPSITKAIDCNAKQPHFRKRTKSNPEVTLEENYYNNPISSIGTRTEFPSCFSIDCESDGAQECQPDVSLNHVYTLCFDLKISGL